MPQLDFSTYFGQAFWFLLVFFTLFCMSAFYFLPLLSKGVGRRNKYIEDNIKASEENANKIKNLEQDIKSLNTKIINESQMVIESQTQESLKLYEASIQKAKDETNKQITKAIREIEQERISDESNSQDQKLKIASDIIKIITGKEIDKSQLAKK